VAVPVRSLVFVIVLEDFIGHVDEGSEPSAVVHLVHPIGIELGVGSGFWIRTDLVRNEN